MSALGRIASVHRDQGTYGVVRFLCSRVARIRRHRVFILSLADAIHGSVMPEVPPGFTVTIASGPGDLEAIQGLAPTAEMQEYLEGIRSGDITGVFVSCGSELAHRAFLMYRSRTLDILAAPDGAMLLGNAFTAPAFRGMGLQKLSIGLRIALARELGAPWVISETAPDNRPSMAAMKRAGLQPAGRVDVLIVLNRFVVRRPHEGWSAPWVGWLS